MLDLWDSLVRRWPFALACFLVAGGLTFFVSTQVSPTYESRADVVLVPPKSVEDPTANRYLSLSGLRQAVDVLTRSLDAEKTHDAVRRAAPSGTFETQADATTSAPILIVTATAATPAAAQKAIDAVLEQVPVTLRELQESVSIARSAWITPQVVSTDEEPRVVNKKQIRVVTAAAAFLLLLSAFVVGAVDNRLLVRSRAQQSDKHDPPRPPAVPPRLAVNNGSTHHAVTAPDETRKRDVVPAQGPS
ncbi:hypothetical protein GEV27_04780 [Aeromicrobium sp. S22]|uniref:hypothetical protein n=1 Tax=Aeromicrobium sp. S22 TaxID=2662029 RepID=UPI00129D83F0|nr:hypothetical protein [Aeromicrobium sp. S22]MRK00830.1 hypothetical protein [Aeromicrobium sp. S22]